MNTTFLHQSVSTRNSLDGNSGICFVVFTVFTDTLLFKFLTHRFALDCFLICILNIRVMLQLACTLPVTSCECERSAITMHRLHTYMRTSMTQERLSSLALLHTHYDVPIDLDKAVDIYSRLHPRHLALDLLNKPYNAVPIDLDKAFNIYSWIHPRRLALDSLIKP